MGRKKSCYNHIVIINRHLVIEVWAGIWIIYQFNYSQSWSWTDKIY